MSYTKISQMIEDGGSAPAGCPCPSCGGLGRLRIDRVKLELVPEGAEGPLDRVKLELVPGGDAEAAPLPEEA